MGWDGMEVLTVPAYCRLECEIEPRGWLCLSLHLPSGQRGVCHSSHCSVRHVHAVQLVFREVFMQVCRTLCATCSRFKELKKPHEIRDIFGRREMRATLCAASERQHQRLLPLRGRDCRSLSLLPTFPLASLAYVFFTSVRSMYRMVLYIVSTVWMPETCSARRFTQRDDAAHVLRHRHWYGLLATMQNDTTSVIDS